MDLFGVPNFATRYQAMFALFLRNWGPGAVRMETTSTICLSSTSQRHTGPARNLRSAWWLAGPGSYSSLINRIKGTSSTSRVFSEKVIYKKDKKVEHRVKFLRVWTHQQQSKVECIPVKLVLNRWFAGQAWLKRPLWKIHWDTSCDASGLGNDPGKSSFVPPILVRHSQIHCEINESCGTPGDPRHWFLQQTLRAYRSFLRSLWGTAGPANAADVAVLIFGGRTWGCQR